MVSFFYFYGIDEDFGPFFLKLGSHFPYTARLCINGNEYAKRQARLPHPFTPSTAPPATSMTCRCCSTGAGDKLDATETHIYVAQTCGRNVVRFPIGQDGSLGGREVHGPLDHGRSIDGIAFDANGNLWGTYVFTDGIFAITPDGETRMIFDDSTPDVYVGSLRGTRVAHFRSPVAGLPLAHWSESIER